MPIQLDMTRPSLLPTSALPDLADMIEPPHTDSSSASCFAVESTIMLSIDSEDSQKKKNIMTPIVDVAKTFEHVVV